MNEKVAIISGAISGIGLATALKFAKNKYNIAILDINETDSKTAKNRVAKMGVGVSINSCDISDMKQVKRAAALALERFGRVDVLINNASFEIKGSLLECSESDWQKTFDTNLLGIFNLSNEFAPIIRKQGGGSVINIGSILAYRTASGYSAYSSSKGAIEALTKSMAYDFGRYNIRVNCVAPGAINTERLRSWINQSIDPKKMEESLNRRSLLNRMGTSDEVANVVYFLSTPEASYVTGSTFLVDGGWAVK